MSKSITTISIDEGLAQKCKDARLNISAVCNNALNYELEIRNDNDIVLEMRRQGIEFVFDYVIVRHNALLKENKELIEKLQSLKLQPEPEPSNP